MPHLLPSRYRRRTAVWGTALLLYDIWRHIPPKQRRLLLAQARKHGPVIAGRAWRRTRRR